MPDSLSSLSLGFAWAYRILAVAAEMVLPGLLGSWLDGRLGTQFLALLGFGLGITLASRTVADDPAPCSGAEREAQLSRRRDRRATTVTESALQPTRGLSSLRSCAL